MISTIGVSKNMMLVSKVLKRQPARLRIGEVGPALVIGRCQSSLAKAATPIDNDSIYVLSIPITNYKSYIFCNHQPSVLDSTQVKSILWVNKLEDKLTSVASKGWKKLNESEVSINVKIVRLINKLLDTIPYEENCLKSFPSQKSMIREVNEEYTKQAAHSSTRLIQSQADKLQIPSNQIKPIPLYHPKFQSPTTILNQLYLFRDDAYKMHLKYSIICAIGIPISLPFALVPILPNVPGFYLAYRLYCNVKALLGVKHLDYLLEDCTHASSAPPNKSTEKEDIETTVNDTKHIAFEHVDHLDAVYLSNTLLGDHNLLTEEKVIITSDIIDSLCQKFNLPHLKDDLHKALRQESHRLKKAEHKQL
ncbi:uncharacterized protein AC631_01710 [Debaryomyces fabryi]|uniref:Uncharacterized protein n=1 Tax=Debaryomyces fabryi TaxID=58627 RepID=A0A0V1Q246_9ASCO|nr:uncharacterized protein AC631_01710 [Debaryomyces fabryi]KSA02535.1 hypothetical protein AC631_01710 [Debaryomyces fabryi]